MVDALLRGHDEFRQSYLGDERDFLRRLASEGQSPGALYVGCSDSRVVPEQLTASSPGDLFVVRNVANLVPPLAHADASVGAALDYALGHLHVEHVVVCGHYGCGGVRAVLDGLEHVAAHTSLFEWLGGIQAAADRAKGSGLEGDALWRRGVQENVLQQLENLVTFPAVAEAVRAQKLALHGWVYDLYAVELSVLDRHTGEFESAQKVAERRQTLMP